MTSTKVKVYIITRTAHIPEIGGSGEFIYGVFSSLEKAAKYLKDYAHFLLQTLEGLYAYVNVYEYTLDDDTHCRKIPLEELKE